MDHCNPLWLQTELSKLLSCLLEEEVNLSVEEALQIASQLRRNEACALIESMFEVNRQ